jgi:hypothetical protein
MDTEAAEPPKPLDDVVDRAARALRDVTVPTGPSALLAARTRQTLSRAAAAGTAQSPRLWRRWAAAVLVGGAGAAAWVSMSRDDSRLAVEKSGTPGSAAVGPVVAATTADADPAPARLTGYVLAEGVPPGLLTHRPLIPSATTGPNCGHHHPPPTDASLLVAAGGGIANVVVSVSTGLPDDTEYPRPAAAAVLDQKDCTYFPRVVTMQVGQELVAKNSDPFLHSVHTNPQANVPVNIAQYTVDPVGARLKAIQAAETFKVTCDLHPWMIAWVAAFDHPFYAVTRADGSFDMPAVPPGTYKLKAWHERLGSVDERVTVTYDGKLPTVRFRYGPDRVAAALRGAVQTADASR